MKKQKKKKQSRRLLLVFCFLLLQSIYPLDMMINDKMWRYVDTRISNTAVQYLKLREVGAVGVDIIGAICTIDKRSTSGVHNKYLPTCVLD